MKYLSIVATVLALIFSPVAFAEDTTCQTPDQLKTAVDAVSTPLAPVTLEKLSAQEMAALVDKLGPPPGDFDAIYVVHKTEGAVLFIFNKGCFTATSGSALPEAVLSEVLGKNI